MFTMVLEDVVWIAGTIIIRAETNKTLSLKDNTIEAQKNVIAEAEKALSEKTITIETQENAIRLKDSENEKLRMQLDEYQRKEQEANRIQKHRKQVFHFIRCILCKLMIVAVITGIIIKIISVLKPEITSDLGTCVGILGLILTVLSILKKDYKRCFP